MNAIPAKITSLHRLMRLLTSKEEKKQDMAKKIVPFESLIALEIDATHIAVQSASESGRGYLVEHDGHNAIACPCKHGSMGGLNCKHCKRVNAMLAIQEVEQEASLQIAQELLQFAPVPVLTASLADKPLYTAEAFSMF